MLFGKVPVLDQILDVQVFVGNHIARGDQRTCLLRGEVFALPTHFKIALRELLSGLLAVVGTFLLARDPAMQALEFLFRLAVKPGVRAGAPVSLPVVTLPTPT